MISLALWPREPSGKEGRQVVSPELGGQSSALALIAKEVRTPWGAPEDSLKTSLGNSEKRWG